MKAYLQWLIIVAIAVGVWYLLSKGYSIWRPHVSLIKVLLFSLSCAFAQIDVFKFGSVKPLNCLKCMTGWYSLIFGVWVFGWIGISCLPVGLLIGAIFDSLKMRWL